MSATGTTTSGASANDRTRAVRDTARDSKNRTIGEAIKRLFRRAVAALTRRASEPPLTAATGKGSRTGFPATARRIVRRARLAPIFDPIFRKAVRTMTCRHRTPDLAPEIDAPAAAYLTGVLDWLTLWQDAAPNEGDPGAYDDASPECVGGDP